MKANSEKHHCPLCGSEASVLFFVDKFRSYFRCPGCELVFVPRSYWLSTAAEKATYDLHKNAAGDPGYRRFLSRLSAPLLEKLETRQKGLDYGCGPGPALPTMLAEHGHHMDLYDPFYYNDPAVFSKTYDFICATEVVEHLRDPDREFSSLFRMLRPGGRLGIMTKLVIDQEAFSRWHYIRDLTHICFYSRSTFEYLARRFNAGLDFVAHDVILMNKI
ncbi:MAG: methyltransferase domain-containing protein [Deltaproteobacteria bacterium]|nr:methyltransferase domain-containing protein [Deltaproteobacteria bacterium]